MKPIDFRNATFEQLGGYIVGQREAVYKAWCAHGPCTTKELAARSGIDVLNVRPRTHDLVMLGFVRLADEQPAKGEGTYRAATAEERLLFFCAQQHEAQNPQRELRLGV